MTRPIVTPASPLPSSAQSSAQAPVLPPTVLSVPADRTVTAIIYGLYAVMVAFVALSLFLVFKFLTPPAQQPPPPTCREDLANSCEEGKYCRQGTCIPVPNLACNEGDPCSDACSCLAPSSCGADQVCRAPVSVAAPKCTEEMKTFVADLLAHQKNCATIAGGPLSSCAPQNVQNFVLAHDKFDVLLNDFGSSLVFMFPSGRPSLDDGERRGDPWNDLTTRSRYVELARGQGETLRRAKHLIIVGRATRTNVAMDYAYAQARVRFARETLLDASVGTKEEGKATARAEMSAKFIEFALGSDRQLQLEFYRSNLRVPTAWWDEDAPRELTTALTKLERNIPVTAKERGEAEQLINRSVAVFAIPPECVKG